MPVPSLPLSAVIGAGLLLGAAWLSPLAMADPGDPGDPPAPPAPGAVQDPSGPPSSLLDSLSKGYSPSNCTAQQTVAGVAAMQCGQNADQNGPIFAKYVQLPSAAVLKSSFANSISADTLTTCGDAKSPTSYHVGTNTAPAGLVACGTYQDHAEVLWTIDDKNIMGLVRSANPDVGALYQWWRDNS